MRTIVVATQNKGKVKEIKEMLAGLSIDVKTMGEVGIDVDIEENGKTFEENAIIKANAISKMTDAIVIADDSGLEIDFLNKEPGVYSARYLGKDTPYEKKNRIIMDRLEGVPKADRTARFVCAMAMCEKGKVLATTEGVIEGYIGDHAEGENGFGYDPIFFVESLGTSTANISLEEKNKISHRGKAVSKMAEEIRKRIAGGNEA